MFVCAALQAQEKFNESLVTKVTDYSSKNFSEKIFVHTDREFYLAGEILWFKVYEVETSQHRPLALNRVVYVELLDKNNEPVVQQKIEMKDGFGNGSMFLPTSLSTGRYIFRAYTNWMKNFDPDFYFQKPISLVNSLTKRDHLPMVEAPKIEATFFPEGGNLMAGIENKIAFKVNDETGKGIDFKGYLLNEHNDTIAKFSPLKFGMGNFSFMPSHDSKYKALIKAGKQKIQTDLPAPLIGYALRVTKSDDELEILVHHPMAAKNEPICLFIHSHQIISKAEVKFLKNDSVSFWVNKNEMPEGISHITIFTKDLQPVCERLYFKRPSKNLVVELQTDKTVYSKREKITLTLQTNDNASLSASIFRLDSLGDNTPIRISEYLWLTSDLKGFIESPEYYFSDDKFVEEAQDNLMLTHGWRRFKWQDVLGQRQMIQFPPEYGGHLIQASILDEKNEPAPNTIGYVSVIGKNGNLSCAQSNTNGDVFFEVKNLLGTQKLVLQTNRRKDSLKHIQLKNPFSSEYTLHNFPDVALPTSLKEKLLNRSVSLQAQLIYSENEIKRTRRIVIDSLPFYGSASEKYLLDDYTRFPVMEEVMREYVPGVLVRKHNNKFHFIVPDVINHTVFSETPLILLDGVPLFEEDDIMNFDPLRVKQLDVITQRYFLGPAEFSGVVSYITYKGNLNGFQLNPKCIVLDYDGLELQREFYSPDYSSKSDVRIPDFRSLAYWNPSIETTSHHQQKVEFFTSDLPGKYQIVIEGISNQGKSGTGIFYFTVK